MYLGNRRGAHHRARHVPVFAAIMRIPSRSSRPIILIVCAIGAYTVESSRFDIWLMLVFGIVGYVFKKLDYPLAPLVLALVLGDRAEDAFRQACLGSAGDLRVFFSNGLVSTLMVLGLALLFWGPIGDGLKRLRGGDRLPKPAE
jgi:TctA family transporter